MSVLLGDRVIEVQTEIASRIRYYVLFEINKQIVVLIVGLSSQNMLHFQLNQIILTFLFSSFHIFHLILGHQCLIKLLSAHFAFIKCFSFGENFFHFFFYFLLMWSFYYFSWIVLYQFFLNLLLGFHERLRLLNILSLTLKAQFCDCARLFGGNIDIVIGNGYFRDGRVKATKTFWPNIFLVCFRQVIKKVLWLKEKDFSIESAQNSELINLGHLAKRS